MNIIQKNPIAPDSSEATRKELEELAAAQSVRPVNAFDSLKADFWPEDESVDDFVRTVRERRNMRAD